MATLRWIILAFAPWVWPVLAPANPVEIDPSPDERQRALEAAHQFARAKLLADEGAFDKAEKAYDQALELDGSDPYSRIEVAKFHSYLSQMARSAQKRLDHLQRAAGFAGEARRMAPDNLEILRNFAQIHLRLGEHQLEALNQAEEAYEELRGKTEGDLRVLTSLGQIYLWRQESDLAVEVLKEAASYLPKNRMIQTMLLEALTESDRKLEAEEALRQLIDIEPTALEYRTRLAEMRAERGDHRGAAEALSSAPPELLENPRLRQFLAQELHLSGANEEALALADALRPEVPQGPAMRRLRVAILSSLTRYEEAVTELEGVLELEQDADRRLQGTIHLSRLLERVGRPEDAAGALRAGLAAPEGVGALSLKLALAGVLERQGLSSQAVTMLEEELATTSGEELPMLGRSLADLLSRMDRSDDALKVLDRTIERLGDEGQAGAVEALRLRRAAVLTADEDWERLEQEAAALSKASSPEIRAAATSLRAEALAGLGRVDEALGLLSDAGDEEAPAPRRLAKRAEILLEHGRDEEAAVLLQPVIERGENQDLFLAAQVYQRVERYRDSIPLLERLLGADEDSLQALFLLGAAHERVGARDPAIAAFRRLLEVAPDHAPTLNYLGYMWAELGENLTEAVALTLRAVALDPDNGAYVDSLGWAYFQLGRYQEARGHLEWAARLIPDDATILEHLGDLYVVLEDLDRARASYRQALDLGGEDIDQLRRKLETLEEKDL